MPLLKPDIRRALEAAGLENAKSEDSTVQQMLNSRGLSKEDLTERLSNFTEDAENESVKLRAIELGFKLHGILKDQPTQPASVTIVIQDPDNKNSFNPALYPRQMVFEVDGDKLNNTKRRKELQ